MRFMQFKIISILLLLMVCFNAAGQLSKDLGYTRSFKGYGYVDTSAANTGGAAKSFAYLITYGDGIKFWLRNAENNRWIGIGMSSGSVYTAGNGIKIVGSNIQLGDTVGTGSYAAQTVYNTIGAYTFKGTAGMVISSPSNSTLRADDGIKGSQVVTSTSTNGISFITEDSIVFREPAFNKAYAKKTTSLDKYRVLLIDSTTGALVTATPLSFGGGGATYTAGNGIKFDGSAIRLGDSLLSNHTLNTLSNTLDIIGNGAKTIKSGSDFSTNTGLLSVSNGGASLTSKGTDLSIEGSISTSPAFVRIRSRNGPAALPSKQLSVEFYPDSIKVRSETTGGFIGYQMRANTNAGTKYLILGMDSTSGGLVALRNVGGPGGSYTAGNGIRVNDGKLSLKDTIDYALNIELRDTADIDGIRNPAISYTARDTVDGSEVVTNFFLTKDGTGLSSAKPESGEGASVYVSKSGFQLTSYRPADPYYKTWNIQSRDSSLNLQYRESRIDLNLNSLDLSAPEGGTLKLFNNSTTDVKSPYSKITNNATGKRLMLLNGVNADVELINPDSLGGSTNKVNTMEVVGDLLNLSSIPAGAERNYFSTSGSASIATSSNELVLNGIATVATTNIVNVPLDMASEKWTQKIRIRCNVTTGTQRVGLGTRPSNRAGINRGFSYTFDAGSGVDKGKGFIFTGNGGTFTQRAVSAALPLSNNDVVELTVERNGYSFNCKSKNITTGDSVTISYDYPVTSTAEPVMLPTSRPAIYQLNQANQTVLSWSFVEQTPTNPYLLIIGDSKTAGHNATAANGRFVNQLQSAHPDSVFAFTGYGDELNDAVKWLYLIKRVKPKNVVIALGSNDIRNTQTEVSIAENLSRIVEACKFINADVYFLGLGENTINQSYLWQFANATLGSSKMITAYPTLAGDGVHLLDNASHTTVKQAIEAKLF